MSWDTVPGRNGEGYPDPTASTALARVQHSQKGLQSKRAGEHFENMITASLNWYCDKGVAFVEKNPEPMKPPQEARPTGTVPCLLHQSRAARLQGHAHRRPSRGV